MPLTIDIFPPVSPRWAAKLAHPSRRPVAVTPMDPSLVRLSKFLSRVLRHAPERAGVTLDAAGWADIEALLAGACRAGVARDRAALERVVRENEKQRFALSPDGARIRASQGHSVHVDLQLAPHVPPEVLYHGTATRHLVAIRREGLSPGRRTHVHLSPDELTALSVGRRHTAARSYCASLQARCTRPATSSCGPRTACGSREPCRRPSSASHDAAPGGSDSSAAPQGPEPADS